MVYLHLRHFQFTYVVCRGEKGQKERKKEKKNQEFSNVPRSKYNEPKFDN